MSQIYFISDGGAIKIGRSRTVGTRFRALETGNPNSLELIACIDGGPGHERDIHKELDAYRLRGEWFADCKQVRDAIARYQAAGAPVPQIDAISAADTIYEADPLSVAAGIISLIEDPDRLARLDNELAALQSERRLLERRLAAIRAKQMPPEIHIGFDPPR